MAQTYEISARRKDRSQAARVWTTHSPWDAVFLYALLRETLNDTHHVEVWRNVPGRKGWQGAEKELAEMQAASEAERGPTPWA